jgi:hypothetical protein
LGKITSYNYDRFYMNIVYLDCNSMKQGQRKGLVDEALEIRVKTEE